MPLAIIHSRACRGIQAPEVTVEVHMSNGLPRFSIVGLAETAVKESKDRVRSAIINSQLDFPARRITVNLAPADLPKEGGRFDLPIAIGILAATRQLPLQPLAEYEFAGELALSGELRSITGALPLSLATYKAKRKLIIPEANADEAALPSDAEVYPATHLLDVCAHFTKQQIISAHPRPKLTTTENALLDLADVKGQQNAKRALEIAAAGQHSLLMVGPPGTGKTMLASRLPGILPSLTDEQALEYAAVCSISSKPFIIKHWRQRPFRAPHHSASNVALVGGGSPPHPGEISLAHHGVLFLDELPEFSRHVIEGLREPMESGSVTISRASYQAEFPASFQLITAMNPCPCGYLGDSSSRCSCTSEQVKRYQSRLSGPLLDRIDMHIQVSRPNSSFITQKTDENTETSTIVNARVKQSHQRQLNRAGKTNAKLFGKEIEQYCALTKEDQLLLTQAMDKLGISARGYHRILRVARTIADLANAEQIQHNHLTEAMMYRRLTD